jgi:hypothetical protein
MEEDPSRTQLILFRVVIWLMIALAVSGAIVYLFSDDPNQRIWRDLVDRPGGKMTFRFVLQPCLAAIAALHDGLKDARTGRTPYLWTILTNSAERRGRLREGIIATARTILLGIIMDAIYQVMVLKTYYPGEDVIVAILLAFVPYLLFRGPIARIARRRFAKPDAAYDGVRK